MALNCSTSEQIQTQKQRLDQRSLLGCGLGLVHVLKALRFCFTAVSGSSSGKLMMASPDVSVRPGDMPQLPAFMPPVTLDSLTPHPYLPLQPHRAQFIIPPEQPESVQSPLTNTKGPKNILIAAKSGALDSVKQYANAGQTEMADNMGEVLPKTYPPG